MAELTIPERIKRALETGNWIIRADNDGISPSPDANGFRWAPLGEWTEAPDFNKIADCGGGLHGQDKDHGGYILGKRLVFCETEGPHIALGEKVKVHRAAILLVNELPEGLAAKTLDLSGCTGLTAIPEGLAAKTLYLSGCTGLAAIPEGLAAEYLDLRGCTGLTAIPDSIRKKAFY